MSLLRKHSFQHLSHAMRVYKEKPSVVMMLDYIDKAIPVSPKDYQKGTDTFPKANIMRAASIALNNLLYYNHMIIHDSMGLLMFISKQDLNHEVSPCIMHGKSLEFNLKDENTWKGVQNNINSKIISRGQKKDTDNAAARNFRFLAPDEAGGVYCIYFQKCFLRGTSEEQYCRNKEADERRDYAENRSGKKAKKKTPRKKTKKSKAAEEDDCASENEDSADESDDIDVDDGWKAKDKILKLVTYDWNQEPEQNLEEESNLLSKNDNLMPSTILTTKETIYDIHHRDQTLHTLSNLFSTFVPFALYTVLYINAHIRTIMDKFMLFAFHFMDQFGNNDIERWNAVFVNHLKANGLLEKNILPEQYTTMNLKEYIESCTKNATELDALTQKERDKCIHFSKSCTKVAWANYVYLCSFRWLIQACEEMKANGEKDVLNPSWLSEFTFDDHSKGYNFSMTSSLLKLFEYLAHKTQINYEMFSNRPDDFFGIDLMQEFVTDHIAPFLAFMFRIDKIERFPALGLEKNPLPGNPVKSLLTFIQHPKCTKLMIPKKGAACKLFHCKEKKNSKNTKKDTVEEPTGDEPVEDKHELRFHKRNDHVTSYENKCRHQYEMTPKEVDAWTDTTGFLVTRKNSKRYLEKLWYNDKYPFFDDDEIVRIDELTKVLDPDDVKVLDARNKYTALNRCEPISIDEHNQLKLEQTKIYTSESDIRQGQYNFYQTSVGRLNIHFTPTDFKECSEDYPTLKCKRCANAHIVLITLFKNIIYLIISSKVENNLKMNTMVLDKWMPNRKRQNYTLSEAFFIDPSLLSGALLCMFLGDDLAWIRTFICEHFGTEGHLNSTVGCMFHHYKNAKKTKLTNSALDDTPLTTCPCNQAREENPFFEVGDKTDANFMAYHMSEMERNKFKTNKEELKQIHEEYILSTEMNQDIIDKEVSIDTLSSIKTLLKQKRIASLSVSERFSNQIPFHDLPSTCLRCINSGTTNPSVLKPQGLYDLKDQTSIEFHPEVKDLNLPFKDIDELKKILKSVAEEEDYLSFVRSGKNSGPDMTKKDYSINHDFMPFWNVEDGNVPSGLLGTRKLEDEKALALKKKDEVVSKKLKAKQERDLKKKREAEEKKRRKEKAAEEKRRETERKERQKEEEKREADEEKERRKFLVEKRRKQVKDLINRRETVSDEDYDETLAELREKNKKRGRSSDADKSKDSSKSPKKKKKINTKKKKKKGGKDTTVSTTGTTTDKSSSVATEKEASSEEIPDKTTETVETEDVLNDSTVYDAVEPNAEHTDMDVDGNKTSEESASNPKVTQEVPENADESAETTEKVGNAAGNDVVKQKINEDGATEAVAATMDTTDAPRAAVAQRSSVDNVGEEKGDSGNALKTSVMPGGAVISPEAPPPNAKSNTNSKRRRKSLPRHHPLEQEDANDIIKDAKIEEHRHKYVDRIEVCYSFDLALLIIKDRMDERYQKEHVNGAKTKIEQNVVSVLRFREARDKAEEKKYKALEERKMAARNKVTVPTSVTQREEEVGTSTITTTDTNIATNEGNHHSREEESTVDESIG